MNRQELKDKIMGVVENNPLGALATIKDGKPWVRYMVISCQDDDFYTNSFAASRKVEQIKKDNNVHLTMGGRFDDYHTSYVNIQGTADIITDVEMKKKFWVDSLKKYFSGPEDPGYVVIKISPEFIEYMDPESMEPEVYFVK